MADVDEVLLISDTPAVLIPKASRSSVRTVVIPLMENHIRHCPRQHSSLIPDGRSIDVLGNKAAFAAYAEANGLAHLCPKSYARIEDIVFPCVLKRVDYNAGIGIVIVRSHRELKWHFEHYPWFWQQYIIQSLTAGAQEYVTHCVCKDGKILWHCSFVYEMKSRVAIRTPLNVSAILPTTAQPFILSQIEKFLSPLAFTGPCNVDYKLSDNGDIVVFEINPRLGGSLMMPCNVAYLSNALSHIIKAALN